jgi:hypothetical protein
VAWPTLCLSFCLSVCVSVCVSVSVPFCFCLCIFLSLSLYLSFSLSLCLLLLSVCPLLFISPSLLLPSLLSLVSPCRPPPPLPHTHLTHAHTLTRFCRSFALEALEQVSPGVREQLAARLLQAPPPAPDADHSPADQPPPPPLSDAALAEAAAAAAASAGGVEALVAGCRDEEALRDVALALLRDQVPPRR